MTPPLLQIERLHAGYSDTAIVRGASLAVAAGEIVCVLGANGAGKSTLVKAVMGLLKVFSGSIVFEGKDVTRVPTEDLAHSGIGYVPQVANVFPSLSVRENLVVGLRRQEHSERIVSELLDFLPALKPKLHAPASALSGGERQMLAFGRCLAMKPRLLLLDEPTAALSPILVGEIFRKIAEIAQLGLGVLLVEQNTLRALEISNRAVVLSNGVNAAEGTAAELLANKRIKELYLGGLPTPSNLSTSEV